MGKIKPDVMVVAADFGRQIAPSILWGTLK